MFLNIRIDWMPEAIHSKMRRSALPDDKLPTPLSQHNRHFSRMY